MLKKALAVSALLLWLPGCGVTEVDMKALEDDIVAELEVQIDAEVTATCPDQIDWNTGGTFTCDVALADGSTRQVEVEMLDDDGQVRWKLVPIPE